MKSPSKKSILVAGGAGFVGSHLCEALIAQRFHIRNYIGAFESYVREALQ